MLTFQIFDGKYFDGWPVSFTKYCIIALKFDRFNFDSLAGKRQKRQNFPRKNFPLYGIQYAKTWPHCDITQE